VGFSTCDSHLEDRLNSTPLFKAARNGLTLPTAMTVSPKSGRVYTSFGWSLSGVTEPRKRGVMIRTLRMLAVVLVTSAIAWSADPVVGTWKLNVSKSKFIPGPAPKQETRVYEAQAGGIKVTVRTVEADGHTTNVHIAANYDGKDYPVTGEADYDAIELQKVGELTAYATLIHGHTVIATGKREVSADGKTLTITYKTGKDQEHQIDNRAVYDKQ
jgi:riboflavin biosynthesis pyrimidine reductase